MKVVIFCGGMGVRMGETTRRIPKPMIRVGDKPILWHIMRWYASWGHKEFLLCTGYRANVIRDWFESSAGVTTDGDTPESVAVVPDDWRIEFLDTGIDSSIGDRLRAAQPYVREDEIFLCTYGDGLTDAPLDDMIDRLLTTEKIGLFMSVRPRLSYHVVDADEDGQVTRVQPMSSADVFINGGFFVLRPRIFDSLRVHEDIMDDMARLALAGDVLAYRYEGFWAPMDTMKDKQDLDAMVEVGDLPWLREPADRALA